MARAARDALPAASRSRGASPHPRLPRPALYLRHPQVLRHFSRRQGGSKKGRKPRSLHPASAAAQEEERKREAGEEAAMKLIPIDNKKNHHHPQQESRVHPPQQRLGVGWAFLLLAPSVAMNPPQAVHTRTPFPSTKRRGRNKRDPQPRHTQQTPQMLKVCGFCNPIFTPSPPE